jgi:hypothetical protein
LEPVAAGIASENPYKAVTFIPPLIPLNLTAKLLLALASTVMLTSESHEIHDHNSLSDGSGNIQNF